MSSYSLLWFPGKFDADIQPCRSSPQTQWMGYSKGSIWRLVRRHVKNDAFVNGEGGGRRRLKNVPVYELPRTKGGPKPDATVMFVRITGRIRGRTLGNLEWHMPGQRIG